MQKAGYVGSYKVQFFVGSLFLSVHLVKTIHIHKTLKFTENCTGSGALEIVLMGVLHFGNLTSEEVTESLIYCF